MLVNGDVVQASALAAVRDEKRVQIALPDEPGAYLVETDLYADGTVIARDAADVLVVARDEWSGEAVRAGDAEVAAWLAALGVPVSDTSDLLVVRAFTDDAQHHARSGGRVLLLAEEQHSLGSAFDFLPSARLTSRAGDGDWVPRTEWLDRRGAFASVPGETVLGIAFEDLLGPLVISGIPGPLRPAVVHSGIFSGWLRGAATSTATVRWSRGAVTISTMRVRDALATAPVARAVGHALLHAARA